MGKNLLHNIPVAMTMFDTHIIILQAHLCVIEMILIPCEKNWVMWADYLCCNAFSK